MMVMLAFGVGLCLFSIGIIIGVLIGGHRMRKKCRMKCERTCDYEEFRRCVLSTKLP